MVRAAWWNVILARVQEMPVPTILHLTLERVPGCSVWPGAWRREPDDESHDRFGTVARSRRPSRRGSCRLPDGGNGRTSCGGRPTPREGHGSRPRERGPPLPPFGRRRLHPPRGGG